MAPTFDTWTVGTIRITRIVELEAAVPPDLLLTGVDAERLAALAPRLPEHVDDQGWLQFSIHGFVVDDGRRRILVDGGVGDDKPRPAPHFDRLHTRFNERMGAAGYPPESIDLVVATHLHLDHVGWFTRRVDDAWVPTFPNARHLVVAGEYAHWQVADVEDGDYMGDSVAPVVEAGLVDLVAPDHEVAPGIGFLPTPGHTPAHAALLVESAGESAVVTGDLVHHPAQLLEPSWGSPFDVDPDAARATRSAFVERFADSGTLVLGTHFGAPSAGRLAGSGAEVTWHPVPPVLDAIGPGGASS